jgi:hypothetical protein
MSNLNQPASPDIGPEGLPTPSLPDSGSSSPEIGPEGLPTPSLPGPVVDFSCPSGYTARTAGRNQTLTDLLLENNVSYSAMLSANPSLSAGRVPQGTRYCAPPSGTRRVCRYGSASYIMGIGEDLNTLYETNGYSARELLLLNPMLAPSDFTEGRVICVPL